MARKITEDFIGTCQCCFGEFKVNEKSKAIVLHGYQRPGHGSIIGDCEGHDKPPFEYDCSFTKEIITRHLNASDRAAVRLSALKAGDALKLERRWEEYDRETRRTVAKSEWIEPGSPHWDRTLRIAIANADNLRIYHARMADHLQEAVDQWKRAPIVGIDVPATGKPHTPRKAYDPAEADAAAARAADKAARDAKPGKLKVILYRDNPVSGMEPGVERFSAHIEATKLWMTALRADVKARFEGKTLVREGSDYDLPRSIRRADFDVAIVHLPWEYRDRVLEFYPTAELDERAAKAVTYTNFVGGE